MKKENAEFSFRYGECQLLPRQDVLGRTCESSWKPWSRKCTVVRAVGPVLLPLAQRPPQGGNPSIRHSSTLGKFYQLFLSTS